MTAQAPDFVLLGPSGFLGSGILRALEADGYSVLPSRLRLQDRQGIERLLDDRRPKLGVICAAGERGRPNISWCDAHPVETADANITGQLAVAAACHSRGLHVTLLGTGALYEPDPSRPGHRFTEREPSNIAAPGMYVALRVKLEELLAFFDNALVLRVAYPVSSDLDARGLLGKLARFPRVDAVAPSVTVMADLFPLIPELARRRVTGPVNFVNRGGAPYAELVAALRARAPCGWAGPAISGEAPARPAPELDVAHLAASCGREVPEAMASLRRIIAGLDPAAFDALGQPRAAERSRSPRRL